MSKTRASSCPTLRLLTLPLSDGRPVNSKRTDDMFGDNDCSHSISLLANAFHWLLQIMSLGKFSNKRTTNVSRLAESRTNHYTSLFEYERHCDIARINH